MRLKSMFVEAEQHGRKKGRQALRRRRCPASTHSPTASLIAKRVATEIVGSCSKVWNSSLCRAVHSRGHIGCPV